MFAANALAPGVEDILVPIGNERAGREAINLSICVWRAVLRYTGYRKALWIPWSNRRDALYEPSRNGSPSPQAHVLIDTT